MSKGRTTTRVSIRLDDAIVSALQERAIKAGVPSVGEYVKAQILKSCSVSTITRNTIEEVIVLHQPTPTEKKEWARFKGSLRGELT